MANKLGEGGDLGKLRFARIQEEYDAVSTKGAVLLNNYSGEKIGTGVFDPLLDSEESEHRDITFFDETEFGLSSTNFGHKRDSYFTLSDYGIQCKVVATGRTGSGFGNETPEIYSFYLRSTSGEVKLHANQTLAPWAEYNTSLKNFLAIVFTLKTSGAPAFTVDNDPAQRFQVYNTNTTGDRTLTWGGFAGTAVGETTGTNYFEGQTTNPDPGYKVIVTIPAGENGEAGEWVKVSEISSPVASKFVEDNAGYNTYPRNVALIDDNVSTDIDHIQIQGLEKITHKKTTSSSSVERFKGTSKKQGKVRKVFDSINDTDVTYLEDYHTGLNYSGDADYTTAVYVLRVESDEPANFATWCSNFISTYGYPKILKSGYTDPADIAAYSVELDNYSIEYISNVDAAADPQCNGAVMIFYATLPSTAVNNSAKDNIFSFGDTGVTIPGLSTNASLVVGQNIQTSTTPLMGGYSSALYFIVGASPDTSDHLITTRKYPNWDTSEWWSDPDAIARSEIVSLSRDEQYKGFKYCTIGGLASKPSVYIAYLNNSIMVPLQLPLLGAETGLNYGNGSDIYLGGFGGNYHYKMKGLMAHALPEPEDASFSSIGDSFNPTYLWGGAYYLGHDTINSQSGVAWSTYQNYHIPKSLRSPWNHGSFVEQIQPNYSNLFDELGNTDNAYILYPTHTDSRIYASTTTRSHVNAVNYGNVHTTGSFDDRVAVTSYSDCSVFPENTFQVCLRGSLGTSKFSWDPRFGDLEDIHGGSVSTTGDYPGYYKYPFETAVLPFDRTYEDDHYWRGGTWDRYLSCHPVQGIGCDAYAVAGSNYPSRYNMLDAFVVNMISFRWDDSYYAPNIPIYFKYGRGDLDVNEDASVYKECYAATPPIYEEYLQLRNSRYHVASTGDITNGNGHDDWRTLQLQGYIDIWDTSEYDDRHGLMPDSDTYDTALPGTLSSSYNSRKMPYMGANPALLMQRNVPVAACNELSLDATTNPHNQSNPVLEPIGKVLDPYKYDTSDDYIEMGFAWRIVCVGTDPLDDDCPIYEVYITDASNIKQFNVNNKQFEDDLSHDEPTGGHENDYFKSEVNLYGHGEIPLDWKGNSQPLSKSGKRIEKLVLRFKPLKNVMGHSAGGYISGAGINNAVQVPPDISGDMWQDFAVAVNIENRYPTANLRHMLVPFNGGTLEKVSLLPSTGSMINYNWGDDQDTGGNGQLVAPSRCGVKLYISDYPDLDKSYPVSKEQYRDSSVRHTDGSYKTGKEALILTRTDQHADERSVSTENNSANANINSDASRFHNDDSYLHGFESLNHQPRLTSDLSIDNNGGPSGVYANNTSLTMRVHGHRGTYSGNSATSSGVSLCPSGTGSVRRKHYRLGNKIGASVGGKFTYRVDPDSVSEEDWGFGGDRYMEMIDSLTIDGSCWPYQKADVYSFGNTEIEYRIGEVTLKNRIKGLIRKPKTFTFYYNDSPSIASTNGNGKFNHRIYIVSLDALRPPESGFNPWNNTDRLGGHDRGTFNSGTTVQGDTDNYYDDNTTPAAYQDRATITVDRGDTVIFNLLQGTSTDSVERQDGHWIKRELNNSHQSDVEGVTNNGWEDIQGDGDPDDKIGSAIISWDTTNSKEGIYYLASGEDLEDAGDPPKYFKIHLK